MVSDAVRELLSLALAHEGRGDVDAAAAAYARAGEVEEAARVLLGAGRYGDAARLLVRALGVPLDEVSRLGADGRRRAQKAAVCFARAGDARASVELFLALGDTPRAAEVLERSGDAVGAARLRASGASGALAEAGARLPAEAPQSRNAARRLEAAGQLMEAAEAYLMQKLPGEAARCYRGAGRIARAAELYLEAGMAYEAAVCFFELGNASAFLEAVARVPREHPRYRAACAQAVRVAGSTGALDFQLDHFLGRFVASGPQSDAELEVFYALAKLYSRHDYAESARDVLARLIAAQPGYRDAQALLAGIEADARGSAMVDAKIRREDEAFLSAGGDRARAGSPVAAAGEADFPDLPGLPPLPGLRTAGGSEPPRVPGTAPGSALGTHVGLGAPVVSSPKTGARPVSEGAIGGLREDRTQAWSPRVEPESPAPPTGLAGQETLIAGRYRVESKLGQGGMAVVYQALDLELGERVAIKLFLQPSDDAQLLQRFRQELAVCRQLAHPNVVRLYDIGTHEGRKFISMELLAGSDLAGLIAGPMDVGRAAGYLVQACAGLAAAHEQGIVHRDIKPENFFVTTEGVLKVMDFGIAKRQSTPGLTVAGFVAGTPEYMAPEQIQNFGTVTHLADLYALGIVAFQLFTGTVPFFHGELMPLLMMHVNTPPPRPSSRQPGLPEEIDALVLSLLEKDPTKRIQSCKELARELRRILR